MTRPRFRLYVYPMSYYSQKVLQAMYEKGAPFTIQTISLPDREQDEDWFLKLNPAGRMPVLQDGDKIIIESETIIDYIDKEATGTTLVPSVDTQLGQDVDRYRKLLDAIPVENITYGIMIQRDLSTTGIKIPRLLTALLTPDAVLNRIKTQISDLTKKCETSPERKEMFNDKIKHLQDKIAVINRRELVTRLLDDLEPVMDQLEAQQKTSKDAAADVGVTGDVWLFGPRFTAADVSLTTLLSRLDFIGLAERYISADKRPMLHDYYRRVFKRPSVVGVYNYIHTVPWLTMKRKILKTAPYIGGIVAVAVMAGLAMKFYK